jgi:hypothetical protein
MKKGIFFFLIMVIVSLLGACHKCHNPQSADCDNYDPCYGRHSASAKFTMMEDNHWDANWRYYDSDTIFGLYGVIFKALSDSSGATFEWRIGAGVYTTPQLYLTFNSVTTPTNIPITLIVHRAPIKLCLPNGASDTVTRILHVIPKGKDHIRVWGDYYGYYTNDPSKLFTIYIHRAVPTDPIQKQNLIRYCNDSLNILSGGWQLRYDNWATDYNYCLEDYTIRELAFQCVDTGKYTDLRWGHHNFTYINAFLDSTGNNISVWITDTQYDANLNWKQDTLIFIGVRK